MKQECRNRMHGILKAKQEDSISILWSIGLVVVREGIDLPILEAREIVLE